MASNPNKKPPLITSETAIVQISICNSTTQERNNTIIQLYKLVKDDPQARRFLYGLLEEFDQKEASA